jgi:hypothetical protein
MTPPDPAPEAPRYTVDNLEAWAAELDDIIGSGTQRAHEEALTMAARFLKDTAGTLRRRASVHQARVDANRAQRRKAARKDRRRKGRS